MNTRTRQQILTVIAIALTFASGATDVTSFTRLGGVFTSVMTGNIVLWGLAIARRSLTLFSHTAVSIAGYITGVAGGTWIAHAGRRRPGTGGRPACWPRTSRWVLGAELTLLAGFTVGWEVSGAAAGRMGAVLPARDAGRGHGHAVGGGQRDGHDPACRPPFSPAR